MGDNNKHYEALESDVDLESITSTKCNALILEKLRDDDDEFKSMGIVIGGGINDDYSDDDFVVEVGDDMGWLGYFIGKNKRLQTLNIMYLPADISFRRGLARNQSIQNILMYGTQSNGMFEALAPFLQKNNTLAEIDLSVPITNPESAQIALLFSGCQIRSLKRLVFNDNELSGESFETIASALRAQPQLEELNFSAICSQDEDAPFFDQRGYVALGVAMRNWRSPTLKKLSIFGSDLQDDGLVALVGGMANCVNLEYLDLGGNGPTVVGFKALSGLLRSENFCLKSLHLSYMGIDDDGMIPLASGLVTSQSLKSLDLSRNNIADLGLKALSNLSKNNNNNLEWLNLSENGPFSAVGLSCFSQAILKALNLKELHLCNNAINDEGLQALAVGLRKHPTLARLDLSMNAIGIEGLRALAVAEITSLRWLSVARNAINDEALGVLAEGIENFVSLETLNLANNNMITSSGMAVLTPIFRRSCSLKEIDLYPTNIKDSEARAFAEGLVGNESLERVSFGCTNITALGWSAFSALLCDTSSVNNVYLSNHTLEVIGSRHNSSSVPFSVRQYLRLNRQNQYDVPMCKILMSYSDLDMTPFLQWKLKLLPFILSWFERAKSCRTYLGESITSFERRELSALYQFIYGLHLLVADGFNEHKMGTAGVNSRKRKFAQ